MSELFKKAETKLELFNLLVGAHGFKKEGVQNGHGMTLVVTSPRYGGGYVAFLAPRDEPWLMTRMICDDDGWRFVAERFEWFPVTEGDTPMSAFSNLAKLLNRLPQDEDTLWKWGADVHSIVHRLESYQETERYYAPLDEYNDRDYLSKT
jgi:hypothetical protein